MLVARDDATLALAALAATGAVELEAREGAALPAAFADLRPLLAAFGELAQRYGAFWPRRGLVPSRVPEPPREALARALEALLAWALEAEPLIREWQALEAEVARIAAWARVFDALPGTPLAADALATAGPHLQVRLALLPPGARAPADAGLLLRAWPLDDALALLAVGTAEAQARLEPQVLALDGRWFTAPAWLAADPAANHAEAGARAADAQTRIEALGRELEALHRRHGLHRALADTQRLQWVLDNVRGLETGALFCWITGWTSLTAAALEHEVDASGARALLRHPPPPAGSVAPLLLVNPAWARPFEVFTRALGMPSGTEADPSRLLAIAVPLMFGYMFGDVGQGLVIAAAGFALRKRFAMARLFIAGGLSAVFFGLLFGSVFSLHLLHPWWLSPLDDPLAVLVAPLVGGALLLLAGLGLAALAAHWRGELGRWLAGDAGHVVCYAALLAALLEPRALVLAGIGALWFCVGHGVLARSVGAALAAVGELVERLLQILINTLSFARVGAFALAHAGLSSAIVALMDAAANPVAAGVVLVIGNAVVIALEGLVVSIQTTRLVLFEFFARFLEAQGRVFRPLPAPPSPLQET
jgi:V/A-type H+-transporting ATPase subunit I